MPSRAESSRATLERAARAASFALLAALAVMALPRRSTGGGATMEGEALPRMLAPWTREAPADTLRLRLVTVPGALERDWLAALAASGVAVAWTGPDLPATAVEAQAVPDPSG